MNKLRTTLRHPKSPEELGQLVWEASQLPKWHLTPRQGHDLEMLSCGGFQPLDSFVDSENYRCILNDMRLADGSLWPIPIVLDVSEAFAKTLKDAPEIALQNQENLTLAILKVNDIWTPDREHEAQCVYGTTDRTHSGVESLLDRTFPVYVGGTLTVLHRESHTTHTELRHTPEELRHWLRANKWKTVVAFQTRNPIHRAHAKILSAAAANCDGLLLHPTTSQAMSGDIDIHTRVHCYQHAINYMRDIKIKLSLLPLSMRMGGPKEAILHGLIRKNYGCTHMTIGRDHAGPGRDADGQPFYGAYDAIELYKKHQDEIGVQAIPFEHIVYDRSVSDYVREHECQPENKSTISGSQIRRMLALGEKIPDWFTYPEVAAELSKALPPLLQRGFTLFLTGLSGSGKSTLARALSAYFLEHDMRKVSLLDGDDVRSHLSSELGFSREHRSLNVRRIGFVASLLTRTGGIALCAPIAPYEIDRRHNRVAISKNGGYIEIHVSTPLEVCQQRDVKGFYKRAQQDKDFKLTGPNDTYETPVKPEVTIDTSSRSVDECVQTILDKVRELGYIK